MKSEKRGNPATRRTHLTAPGISLVLGACLLISCASGPLPLRETSTYGPSLKVTENECPVWKRLLGRSAMARAAGTGIQYRCRFTAEKPEEVVVEVAQAPPSPPEAVLDGVNFAFDHADLSAEAQAILQKDLEELSKHPDSEIHINGYTDSIGSAAYNVQLSIRRAEAVKDFLVKNGIDAKRIGIAGHGEADPIASNETAEGRALNRRATLEVL